MAELTPTSMWVKCCDCSRELVPPPETNSGFTELGEVKFLRPSGTRFADCQLLVDDAPLQATHPDGQAGWLWKPGFYAGEVRAELISPDGKTLGEWCLDVSPDEHKLGRDHFREMLADLAEYDASLVIGQEPARKRFGSLGVAEEPLVALARLRSRTPAIKQTLRAVLQEPQIALTARRSLVPLHQIRRADRQTAMAALRQPQLLAAMGKIEGVDAGGNAQTLLADVPDVEHHYDSPANRCMLAMLRGLQRRCLDLSVRLNQKVTNEQKSDTESGLADRWPKWREFLEDMQNTVKTATNRKPFSEVRRSEITAAGLNAVSAHQLYSRFYRLAWEALRTGVEGLDVEDYLPLSPTWEIYERWCFMELGKQLQEIRPEFTWQKKSREILVGHAEDGSWMKLELQASFGSTNGIKREGYWSVSGRRIPDVVLSWEVQGEAGFLVMDAKYRVTRENVLDGMASAHIYQDALRMDDRRPVASLLLVPKGGGAAWLEEDRFVREHRVGVVELGAGVKPTFLAAIDIPMMSTA